MGKHVLNVYQLTSSSDTTHLVQQFSFDLYSSSFHSRQFLENLAVWDMLPWVPDKTGVVSEYFTR